MLMQSGPHHPPLWWSIPSELMRTLQMKVILTSVNQTLNYHSRIPYPFQRRHLNLRKREADLVNSLATSPRRLNLVNQNGGGGVLINSLLRQSLLLTQRGLSPKAHPANRLRLKSVNIREEGADHESSWMNLILRPLHQRRLKMLLTPKRARG